MLFFKLRISLMLTCELLVSSLSFVEHITIFVVFNVNLIFRRISPSHLNTRLFLALVEEMSIPNSYCGFPQEPGI